MISIVEQVYNYAKTHKDKIAISNGKISLTYGKLICSIEHTKVLLSTQYNLKKQDVVLIAADKQIEFVSIYLACHLLGIIVVPISPDTNQERFLDIVQTVMPKISIGYDNKVIKNFCYSDFSNFDLLIENLSTCAYPNLYDLADYMFTTGTTAKPKCVKLSHLNISASAENINLFIQNAESDVELLMLPISHSFGLGRLRCALSKGQTIYMLGNFVNIKKFYRFITDFKINGFGLVPSSWALIKKLSGTVIRNFANQLKYIEIGSAPMDVDDKKLLSDILPNTRICMHYGLTEASRSCFLEFHSEIEHINSVGKASPNVKISVKNDDGFDVLPGTEGEICIKGNSVTSGYLNESNELYFHQKSWFRTGDYGYIDNYGYLFLLSRVKEIINVGGKKVNPSEVESVLLSCELVKDCACIGVEDPQKILGDVVFAYVVSDCPSKITKDFMDNYIGVRLEFYKHPIDYKIVDKIPRTSSGKIKRLLLKQTFGVFMDN